MPNRCFNIDDWGLQWHCRKGLSNTEQSGTEINRVTQASTAGSAKNGSIVCRTISKQAFPFSITSLCGPLCLSSLGRYWHVSVKTAWNNVSCPRDWTWPLSLCGTMVIWYFMKVFFCYVAMCTVVDGAAVAAEVALHEGSLFLWLPGPAHPRPPVQIRLHHQGLLTFLFLLLFQ